MTRNVRGFTLVELLIVVAIIGVIAGIAYPSYVDSVKKSQRSDAITALLELQLQEERHRTTNPQYTSTLSDIWSGTTSTNGFYNLTINAADASGYTITASPTGNQSGDSCGDFRINQNGPVFTGGYADKTCWNQ